MTDAPPKRIAINRDDYHARYVGRTADGRQFFLTTPFIPAIDGSARYEFTALYIFDDAGLLIEAQIDDLGTRTESDEARAVSILKQRLGALGTVEYCRIEVQPFQIARFGTIFGLVPSLSEDEKWWVELHPGNYMAFHEPWDSGVYNT
jgi:hypothetical protein